MLSIFTTRKENSDDKAREEKIEAIRAKQKKREEALLAKYPDVLKEGDVENDSKITKQSR